MLSEKKKISDIRVGRRSKRKVMNKGFFWKGIVQMSFRGRRGMISEGEEN